MAPRAGAEARCRRGDEARGQAAGERAVAAQALTDTALTDTGPTGFAPAKVNLHLHIVGRRPDSYHLLDSLVVFPAVGDRLSAEPADDLTLAITGRFAAGLSARSDNLVMQAALALARHAGVPARAKLTLDKAVPVASGIGGGSADAAAALRLLSALWNLPQDRELDRLALDQLALALGADVPVCLRCRPARLGGIGEDLAAAPALPGFGMVLVNPGVAVATPAVFRARAGGFSAPAVLPTGWQDASAMAASLSVLANDLQNAAISLCPPIAGVLATLGALPGCLMARMSGSGATCFALFADAEAASSAAASIARPDWWIWGGAGLVEHRAEITHQVIPPAGILL